MAKIKETGRPSGSANKRSGFVRDEKLSCRVTEGFNKTVAALIAVAGYSSASDVVHDAVQQLAYKKLSNKTDLFYVSKIQ